MPVNDSHTAQMYKKILAEKGENSNKK